MQASRIEVYREPPTPRDSYTGLSGVLKLKLKAISYIHVGSGAEALTIPSVGEVESMLRRGFDRAIEELNRKIGSDFQENIKVSKKPCIPGSTVKGRTRSRIELSIPPRGDGKQWSCFNKATFPQSRGKLTAWRHRKLWDEKTVTQDRGPSCDLTLGNTVCLTCDMFGAAGLQGLVYFNDFVGEPAMLEKISGEFDMKLEAIRPGSELVGNIYFRNLSEARLGLLLYGLGICGTPSGSRILIGRLKYRRKLAGKEFGAAAFTLTDVQFTHYRQSENLNTLCSRLWEAAKKEYDVREFDEVERLERA
jgi:RAMP superfamily.